MKHKALTIRLMLALVLVLLPALAGTAGAQEPEPVEVDEGVWVTVPSEPVVGGAELASGSHLTGVNIAIDLTHNTAGRQNLVTSFYQVAQGDLTGHGASLTFVTSGPLTLALLSGFDAWWIEEDWGSTFSPSEKADLRKYVEYGGCLFFNGDEHGLYTPEHGAIISLFDMPYANRSGASGFTTDVTPHFITTGVSQVLIPAPVNSLAPVPPAFDIIRDRGGNKMVAVRTLGAGGVAVFSDEITGDPYINQANNRTLAIRVFEWCAVGLNQPPTADPNGPYYGDEGSSISLDGTGSSDPDGDPLTYSWSVDSLLCTFDDATSPTPNLTCTDNGDFTVTLVVDDGQATGSDTAAVTVYNVEPTVGPISVDATLVAAGTPINASAGFTDPGTADTHTAVWDWGDGTTPGTVTQGAGSGSVDDSHTYSTAGVYTIQLTVTDDDTESGQSVFQYVVVYDPSAGFVTGGGWIDSPVGAYAADPELTGRATFGFVSKYKKGADTPTGNTEFQFHAADLNFHSSGYEWLVVTGSDYARFKGLGTINGEGAYKFMLWAGDGEPDTFRIRIWEEDEVTAAETDVYDNGFDQAIGGGSIVIHTGKK